MADWSLLPKDLLELIDGRFETCLETVHLRSVCSLWRSALPPPSYKRGLGVDYLLPIFSDSPLFKGENHCILKKIPNFLFRYQTPFGADCLLAGLSKSKSDKQKLVSPLPGFGFTSHHGKVLNTLTTQIIPLDHDYMIKFYATIPIRNGTRRRRYCERAAFLPLDGKDFIVVAGVLRDLMMYRSYEERWTKIEGPFPFRPYSDIVSFKGKFYVSDRCIRGYVFVIEPSLEISEIDFLIESQESSRETLVVSGDELLLVQQFTPGNYRDEHMHTWFRLFRLEEEEGQRRWVRVTDLDDRVVFLGVNCTLSYSAKEIPGMKGNRVMFTRPYNLREDILVFDLETRKTTRAFPECRGIGMLEEDNETLLSCGIVTSSNPAISFYD